MLLLLISSLKNSLIRTDIFLAHGIFILQQIISELLLLNHNFIRGIFLDLFADFLNHSVVPLTHKCHVIEVLVFLFLKWFKFLLLIHGIRLQVHSGLYSIMSRQFLNICPAIELRGRFWSCFVSSFAECKLVLQVSLNSSKVYMMHMRGLI